MSYGRSLLYSERVELFNRSLGSDFDEFNFSLIHTMVEAVRLLYKYSVSAKFDRDTLYFSFDSVEFSEFPCILDYFRVVGAPFRFYSSSELFSESLQWTLEVSRSFVWEKTFVSDGFVSADSYRRYFSSKARWSKKRQ